MYPYFALDEIRRVMRPEGKLIISTHALNLKRGAAFLFGQINPTSDISLSSAEHVGIHSHRILERVIARAGFRVLKWRSWFNVPGTGRFLRMTTPCAICSRSTSFAYLLSPGDGMAVI